MKTTVDIILYKSKTNKDGSHPLVLRLTQNRKRKYRNLGFSFKTSEWNESKNKPKDDPDCNIEEFISNTKRKYNIKLRELARKGDIVTLEDLIDIVEKPDQEMVTVHTYFEKVIEAMRLDGKLGNARTYNDVYRDLKKFRKKDVYFTSINYTFLKTFESFMRRKGMQDTTISIRMRTLRALYNEAVRDDKVMLDGSEYPFKIYKIGKRLNTETRKRALKPTELSKILNLENKIKSNDKDYHAYLYFLFGYYSLGMNFTDMARLSWKDIDYEDKMIHYRRTKTGKIDDKPLLPEAEDVLTYFKTITNSFVKENYVFPILFADRHISKKQIDNRIHKMIGEVNKSLKNIAVKAGIEVKLTTYVWRHTMASELQRKNVSIEEIRELMNHRDIKTTETYLRGITRKQLHKSASVLSKKLG